jgi:hypothetical protein
VVGVQTVGNQVNPRRRQAQGNGFLSCALTGRDASSEMAMCAKMEWSAVELAKYGADALGTGIGELEHHRCSP